KLSIEAILSSAGMITGRRLRSMTRRSTDIHVSDQERRWGKELRRGCSTPSVPGRVDNGLRASSHPHVASVPSLHLGLAKIGEPVTTRTHPEVPDVAFGKGMM